jgi:signal transduction histidine kinase
MITGVLLNVFLLEKYYIYKSKDTFGMIVDEVKTTLSKKDNMQQKLEELDRTNGVSISVADKDYAVLFTSFPQKKDDSNRLPKEIEKLIEGTNKNIKETAVCSVIEKNNELTKLAYIMQTSDGKYIVITKPMKGIHESVGFSNQFYIIAGFFTIIIGSFFMFRFSDKVTKPIVEMSKIAEDISNLNFDKKVEVKSQDELGVLANSINKLSDKLKVSIEGLKKDIEFQQTLSRNMFHELKTPIGVIKGYAEGLAFGIADNSEMRQKYVEVIVSECDRMNRLIIEMLELSKIEAKDYSLKNIVEFELSKLFDSVAKRFEHILTEKNIKLLYEYSGEIHIRGSYELLERAVNNLVSNAIKYNDENKYIRLSARENVESVQISVFNTCKGIPQNEIGKIFDAFYKIDKAHTRENGGYGLGLSIVKSIIKLHHGSIFAENKKGGVEFIIKLPKNRL